MTTTAFRAALTGPAMLLAAMLAGCTAAGDRSEAQTVVRSPLPPLVTGPIDGIYRGMTQLVTQTAPGCPEQMGGLLEVGDHKILFPYNADLTFISVVALDGTLKSREGGYELDGTLRDGHIDATVTGPACTTRLTFDRVAYF